MGVNNARYCIRAVKGKGWRIYDRKMKKWWGNFSQEFPSKILDRLNSGNKSGLVY